MQPEIEPPPLSQLHMRPEIERRMRAPLPCAQCAHDYETCQHGKARTCKAAIVYKELVCVQQRHIAHGGHGSGSLPWSCGVLWQIISKCTCTNTYAVNGMCTGSASHVAPPSPRSGQGSTPPGMKDIRQNWHACTNCSVSSLLLCEDACGTLLCEDSCSTAISYSRWSSWSCLIGAWARSCTTQGWHASVRKRARECTHSPRVHALFPAIH